MKVVIFKRLIYAVIFVLFPLTIVALLASSVVFYTQTAGYKEEVNDLKAEIDELKSLIEESEFSPEDKSAQTTEPPFRNHLLDIVRQGSSVSETDKATAEKVPNDVLFEFHPDFKQDQTILKPIKQGTAYLTFDDGPSVYTRQILSVLREYEVKATFFVLNSKIKDYDLILREIIDEGHSLGMHTATHDYKKIYKSYNAYIDDLYKNFTYIWEATGYKPEIMRFAGGSINSYNAGIYKSLVSDVTSRGFVYYDWNVSTGDALSPMPEADEIVRNVLDNIDGRERVIILAHDTSSKLETIKAIPRIIEGVREAGFTFERLTPDVPSMSLNNRK